MREMDKQTRAWLEAILRPLKEELRTTEAQYALVLKRTEGLRLAIKGLTWMAETERQQAPDA